jgi:hypothetical protein
LAFYNRPRRAFIAFLSLSLSLSLCDDENDDDATVKKFDLSRVLSF